MIKITKKIFLILNNRNKKVTILISVLMVIGAFMESLGVSLIMPLMTSVLDIGTWDSTWYGEFIKNLFDLEDQTQYIIILLSILIAIYIIKNLYLIFEYHAQFSFIANCRFDMQKNLFNKYLYRPYTYFLESSTGEIIRVLSSDTNQTTNILTNLLMFYTELIVAIALVITLFLISFKIAVFLGLIIGSELLVITLLIKPIMLKAGNQQRYETELTNKWILQGISGIKSIKVTKTETFFEKKYSKHASCVIKSEIKSQTLSNLPRLIIEACTVSAVLTMFIFSLTKGNTLTSLIPQMSAFIVAAVRLLPSVNRISSIVTQTPYLEGGLDSVIKNIFTDNIQTVRGDQSVCERSMNRVELNHCISNGDIALKGISFSYPDTNLRILDKADMKIRRGQSVGIVGPSGAGKTTSVDIMLGLLHPSEGTVSVGGINIMQDYTLWLSKLAYIPQQIFLMDDTIRANVAFGIENKDIDDDRVWKAIEEAQLIDYVRNTPDGLYSKIGEHGIRLSGGQRQRIGIARALYRDPDIIFLDEATSALDNETEAAIMESVDLLKGKKTLIIIAHRLTTIKSCDAVYKVDDGKIVQER